MHSALHMLLHSLRALPLQLKVISPAPAHVVEACPAGSLCTYQPSPCTSSTLRAPAFKMCRLHNHCNQASAQGPSRSLAFASPQCWTTKTFVLRAHTSSHEVLGHEGLCAPASESILFQVDPASQESKVKRMWLMFQCRSLNIFKEEESGDQVQAGD